jgi:hypothetical protein
LEVAGHRRRRRPAAAKIVPLARSPRNARQDFDDRRKLELLRIVNSVPFEISLVAEGGILFIGVRVPESASEADIEIVITKLVEAFASVEHLDETEMQHLLFDDLSDAIPEAAPGFIVRRPYTDPQYPAKIDSALKRLTSHAPTLH